MLTAAITEVVDHPCIKHVTPEMTMRYAQLSSDTVRSAYEAAVAKTPAGRLRLVATTGGHFVPDRIEWLGSEMLKTRIAHGYCARHPAAGACPYANICEQCENFTTGPEFLPALKDQLADVVALRDDATSRGWPDEGHRHDTLAATLKRHISRVEQHIDAEASP